MFDEAKADRAVRFIETLCSHTKGAKGGQPFILEPWQRDEIIRPIFGTVRDDGLRQYRTVYIELPRKQGKSTLASAIALYMLMADGEPGAEIISAAADRNQASLVFDQARSQIQNNATLRKAAKVFQNRIEYGTSWYKSISAEANTKHGFNAHCVIFDELHAMPNDSLFRVLETSTGARTQPLFVSITTAGESLNSICGTVHEYAIKVRDGIVDDPTFLPIIYAAESDDDWTQPETWHKANPALGSICSVDYFETQVRRAKVTPSYVNTFKRLHLNVWVGASTAWITDDEFMKGNEPMPSKQTLSRLPCWCGLDLAATRDLTCFASIWHDAATGRFYLDVHSFVNEEQAESRRLSGGTNYYDFQQRGELTITDGNVTDFRAVRDHIVQFCDENNVQGVAYDRKFSTYITPELIEHGIRMCDFGQGFYSMSYPTKTFEIELAKGNVIHGGHNLLRWQFSCVHLKRDDADNIKVVKHRRNSENDKVDAVVASIMALGQFYADNQTETGDQLAEIINL